MPQLREDAVLLHTRTRPDAWETWARLADRSCEARRSQSFEHFYISLQAAIAGIGVAVGPWQLVRDDIDSGILTAPMGFTEDGTTYHLLAPAAIGEQGPHARLRDWLLAVAQ